jgi:hypothetical protein
VALLPLHFHWTPGGLHSNVARLWTGSDKEPRDNWISLKVRALAKLNASVAELHWLTIAIDDKRDPETPCGTLPV